MSYTIDLAGHTALITGASSGLGRHFAHVLAGAGARVVLAARRVDALESLRAEIGEAASVVAMDVTDGASVREAIAAAGTFDILINNAGVAITAPFLEYSEADWDQVVQTNLKGAFLVAQESARVLQKAGGGAIVNVASILGLRVIAQLSAYVASKAALIQLTRSMALELARYKIRVNALCPGYIETDINRDFFTNDPGGTAMIRRVPMRRLGQPGDLDGALLLLCSDAGAYITGVALPVDGGHLVSSL
jgi:NAD(P)-dependent dehydrogenase (short-subunit alcohol dehydrogenase family)